MALLTAKCLSGVAATFDLGKWYRKATTSRVESQGSTSENETNTHSQDLLNS